MTAKLFGNRPIDTIICDIDGVLLLGSNPIPGAGAALNALNEAGLRIVFATNNSLRPPVDVSEHVHEIVGFRLDPDLIISSGLATARYLAGKVQRVFVVGAHGLRSTLQSAGIQLTDDWREADAVVSGSNLAATYDDFAAAGLAIQNGATFYATNSDPSYPRPEGLYPGAGALAAVISTTTGQDPIFCGKPHQPMLSVLAAVSGSFPMVVGDRPDTDLALGKAGGWPTALVLTGVIDRAEQVPGEWRPDTVLSSIVDLPVALGIDGRST